MTIGSLFYPAFTAVSGIAFLLLVPKGEYKRNLLYGLIFGGVGDAVMVTLMTKVFHAIQYKELGHFGIFGLFTIWTPIAWAFAYSMFFYLLPARWPFLVPYILAWAGLSYMIGLVMQSLGLFQFISLQRYIAPLVFTVWYSLSAYVFIRNRDKSHRTVA